ncbi:hypothetical protein CAPTEDRAFT_156379 [Capitella teleta]|uniref:TPX2 C-terminal domain-containing protein n=1 Tax=Capitella teleta TaxID=283909 RepID=R7THT5_CAPTE|nr:hypothetical protein CAPTEDRAFT_156379 [Capitella teleta]|eukprot:ELT91121.1 hypothetical protein CAPTEDRAFT_156379 [Capitella teleta]
MRSTSSTPARNEAPTGKAVLSNVCTDLDAWRTKTAHCVKANNQRRQTALRLRSKSINSKVLSPPKAKPEAHKLARPVTPKCLKRSMKPAAEAKNHEERQMEEIAEKRKALVRMRKLATDSLKAAMKPSVPATRKVKVTHTDEFHFATDSRLKSQNDSNGDEAKSGDFIGGLRKHSPHASRPQRTITRPAPFHLSQMRKRKPEEETAAQKYKTVAEQCREFSTKTPERFHSQPHGKGDGPSPSKRRRDPSGEVLTKPRTPNLQSRLRHRPVAAESQAEKEEREAEEVSKFKFKARPLNERILRSTVGVKKVPVKEITQPVTPDLHTNHRAAVRPKPSTEEESSFDRTMKSMANHKVPFSGLPFQPALEHKITEPEPFSFDSRDKERWAMKEQKIQQIYEEEKKAREFHAHPLPDLSPDVLPAVPKKPPTKMKPFDLDCQIRGTSKAEEWGQKIEEELRQKRALAKFKARPASVLEKAPFIPEHSNKPLTDVTEVTLNTEKRAEERHEWETHFAQQRTETELQKHAAEQLRLKQEEEEVKHLRQEIVHKANPIRQYKSVEVHSSSIPLTNPQTPRFSARLQSRGNKQ